MVRVRILWLDLYFRVRVRQVFHKMLTMGIKPRDPTQELGLGLGAVGLAIDESTWVIVMCGP